MRSRYAAYAKGLADYIIDTTHPTSPHARPDRDAWRAEVLQFSRSVRFAGLRILEAEEPAGDEAFVCFQAVLRQRGQDVGFIERSRFVRESGRWLYVGCVPRMPG